MGAPIHLDKNAWYGLSVDEKLDRLLWLLQQDCVTLLVDCRGDSGSDVAGALMQYEGPHGELLVTMRLE